MNYKPNVKIKDDKKIELLMRESCAKAFHSRSGVMITQHEILIKLKHFKMSQ